MKLSAVHKAVRESGYLTPAERLVMLTLLTRAGNADAAIDERFTPTITQLVKWTGLDRRTVQRALNHLNWHKWLARTTGRGRGHKSGYRPVPVTPDDTCSCQKRRHDDPFSDETKGGTRPPISPIKGGTRPPEKAALKSANGQVRGPFALGVIESEELGVMEPDHDGTLENETFSDPFRCCDSCGGVPARLIGFRRLCQDCARPADWETGDPA